MVSLRVVLRTLGIYKQSKIFDRSTLHRGKKKLYSTRRGAVLDGILVPPSNSLLNMDSQTFIHLSTTLRYQNYCLVASWVYDCFLTLDQEVSLIHRPRWSKGSILYILTRYMPALMLSARLCMNYLPNEKFVTCNVLQSIWYYAAALCVTGAEGIFMLRTYALWGHKRSILGLMLSTVLCLTILNVVITLKVWNQSRLHLSDIGGGCYSLSHNTKAAYNWSLLAALELEVMVLTMIRVYWAYRERRCLLLDILVQHNIFYFGTGLTLSVLNILTIQWLPLNSSNMFATFQIVMHTVLVTRMHLQFYNTVYDSPEPGTTSHSQLTNIELQTRSHSNA
ncbi:uncharacterized protein F5147DRAFT_183770 [Suillus discolor]|uniref:DUF6533 domain-containing protein n=1 Tax=Suillus discolor TaxID=1912936 RepID=A0A9P7K0A7_9AGAM|nr:uncharacterized protein F5147DRAFT_183770 [Suillus discolor]KAG2118704.1 hypothetical protein F5147DRAFT_183770 [Suillus discolor]